MMTAQFRPSPYLAAPRASVAVFALCADTEAEARRLARSRDLILLRLAALSSLEPSSHTSGAVGPVGTARTPAKG